MKDWRESNQEEQRIMWNNARTTKYVTLFCFSSSTASAFTKIFQFVFIQFADGIYTNKTVLRPLFLKASFPFESHNTPVYELVCLLQMIAGELSSLVFSSFDGYFIFSILHFSGQLHNLSLRMKNLVDERQFKEETFHKVLKSAVLKHKQIIRYPYT